MGWVVFYWKKINHQNFDPYLLHNKTLTDFPGDVFFWKKKLSKSKWLTQKNWVYQNCRFNVFACFRPYVRQLDDRIGRATLMPVTSISPTEPMTNFWNFWEKILRIGGSEKLSFFEWAILDLFFQKGFFCLIPMKVTQSFLCSKNES